MKIATWNINSVRLRKNLIEKLNQEEGVDIICLQETKVQDQEFPLKDLKKIGYEYIAFRGEKSYNGVAILSKIPLSNVQMENVAESQDTRHISAVLPDGTVLHNFYIPAGGDEPDVDINPKYKFKLKFVDYMTEWLPKIHNNDDKAIIVGDFNIAPYEHDVWSSKQLRNVVSHTDQEREKLNKLRDSLGWVDVAREFVPMDEKLYSWWSYRNRDWKKSNRGRRLDHIWVTPELKGAVKSYKTMPHIRDWERPSDHVPVVIELK